MPDWLFPSVRLAGAEDLGAYKKMVVRFVAKPDVPSHTNPTWAGDKATDHLPYPQSRSA